MDDQKAILKISSVNRLCIAVIWIGNHPSAFLGKCFFIFFYEKMACILKHQFVLDIPVLIDEINNVKVYHWWFL